MYREPAFVPHTLVDGEHVIVFEPLNHHEQQLNELYGEIGRLTTQVSCAQRAPKKNLASTMRVLAEMRF